jgi:pyruvate-formate lyase-activating enzyme
MHLTGEFLIELFQAVKKLGLTCYVDTNGSTALEEVPELFELMDAAMLNIKSFESHERQNLTGLHNKTVLDNAAYLAKHNKLYEVRTVVVPDLLDNKKNIAEISKLLSLIAPEVRYKLIKFRPLGVREDQLNTIVPSDEYLQELSTIARNNGLKNIIVLWEVYDEDTGSKWQS